MAILLHPGLLLIAGAFLFPFMGKKSLVRLWLLILPACGLLLLFFTFLWLPEPLPPWPGSIKLLSADFFNLPLVIFRVNRLSILFACVFLIAALCMNLYAFSTKNRWEHTAAMIYAGAACGAVFAGDLFTLFCFLEIMSIAPFFLLLFRGTKKSMGAALRYILWHHASGALILSGIIIHYNNFGTVEFTSLPWTPGNVPAGSWLILAGFLVNSATVPFHSWLSDTYSEAGVSGSIYMTAYTTKTAVFCMIVAFPGVKILLWLGVCSAMFAVFMAVLENDGRRLLSYHIISQVGYMVAGIGIGSQMAINGAAAHAFCHIIYKSLLYMGAGCVLYVTGTARFDLLGGLYRYMPISFWLTMVGAFSISGFPLFSGFVSKTMTIEASETAGFLPAYLLLEGASIGTFLHTGLKLPWNMWLKGMETPPARLLPRLNDSPMNSPKHMIAAMSILALLCLVIGIYPAPLYSMLPYPVEFVPYTITKVFSITQMFIFSFLAFWLLRKYLAGHPGFVLDTDWPLRMAGPVLVALCRNRLVPAAKKAEEAVLKIADTIKGLVDPVDDRYKPPWPVGYWTITTIACTILFIIFKV